MSPRITRIEDAGPARKARRVVFDDGSDARVTSAVVVKQLGLQEGVELDARALERALAEAEAPAAKERALALLGYRERTVQELERALRDSGYPAELASSVTGRFAELGFVDDARFAGMWVRTRLAAGYGARRILRELSDRGVAPELAAAAIESEHERGSALEQARAALRGKRARDRKERDKLVRRLVSRGFDLNVALEATAIQEAEDDAVAPE